jgi:hypothetical protein
MTKKTLEGNKFVSNRFEKVNTVEDMDTLPVGRDLTDEEIELLDY